MAKKSKKVAKKNTKKPAAKKPAKKTAKKASAKASKSTEPKLIKRGRGPDVAEIGAAVVAGVNAGKPEHALWDKYWSPKVVSVEGGEQPMMWNGRAAMEGKGEWFYGAFNVHGVSAEGPYIGGNQFSIKFRMEVEEKATGQRTRSEEIGVYTVENGKIVREEFMYGARIPVLNA